MKKRDIKNNQKQHQQMASAHQENDDGTDTNNNLAGGSANKQQSQCSNDVVQKSPKDRKTHNVGGSHSNRDHNAPEKGRNDEVLSNQDTSERSFKEDEQQHNQNMRGSSSLMKKATHRENVEDNSQDACGERRSENTGQQKSSIASKRSQSDRDQHNGDQDNQPGGRGPSNSSKSRKRSNDLSDQDDDGAQQQKEVEQDKSNKEAWSQDDDGGQEASKPNEPTTRKTAPDFDHGADFLSFSQITSGAPRQPKQKLLDDRIQSQYDREEKYPWLSDETLRCKQIFTFFHNEILDFVSWIEQTDEQRLQRENLVKKVKKIVKENYPQAVVMVFGSCATGLNLPQSDIDLLVYHPEVKDLTMINRLSNALLKSGICRSIEPLKHTRVPLIKVVDKTSGIHLDISFNRTNGIYSVKLVKYLQKKYPELRPMIMVLKAFLKSRQLNETYHGGVGSFLLTMLVTSYLQRCYKKGGTDKMDLGMHLIEFFKLYGMVFNYERVGISIRKEGSYFCKQKRGWANLQDEKTRFRLSVENPQEPDVDIGRPAFAIKKVQRAFQHAYDTLVYNNMGSVSLLQLIITSNPKDLLDPSSN